IYDGWYERSLALPHGPGVLAVQLGTRRPGVVSCRFALSDARDLAPALERTRRMLDADCDPVAVDEALGDDPLLGPLVAARPGLRVPGSADGPESAVRTVLGQQVSVQRARRLAGSLVAEYGEPIGLAGDHAVTRLFPTSERLADLSPE